MQLRSFASGIRALPTFSLLQDGYTLGTRSPRHGEVRVAEIAHVGAAQAGQAWQAIVTALRRSGERIAEGRRQEAARLIRRVSARCGIDADIGSTAVQPAVSREVSQRRAEAMRGFFPKLASWYEHRSYMAEMRDVDRYLSKSCDLADLERRVRDVERRGAGSGWL